MDNKVFLQKLAQALPTGVNLEDLRGKYPSTLWENMPELAAMETLARGLMDIEAYLKDNPDVCRAKLDPVYHFVKYGLYEGRTIKFAKNISLENDKQYEEVPKVSVLVPVFNNAEYLDECITSIIKQTLKEIEIIIINDGSTDEEAISILKEFARQDKRITLINKKNTGYGHSMNVGLDNAKGEYIGIVESDDFIRHEMYETYYNKIKEYELDFVKSDATNFFGHGKNRVYETRKICDDDSKYDVVLDPWNDFSLFSIHNVIWNGLYSRQFISKNNIRFNETPGASFQDNGFWFQTLIYTHRFMITKDNLYRLRRDNAGSSFYDKDKAFCMCNEYKYIYDVLKKSKELYTHYRGIYNLRRYGNYIFTLQKIDKQYMDAVLKRMCEDFREAKFRGEIDKQMFGDKYESLCKMINGTYSTAWIKHPKISVIVPMYNCEKYIDECLDNLIKQNFENFEVICVDDGSTDKTLPKIKEKMKKDARIKLFRQRNKGAGSARNTGLKQARGDYLVFLDADDLIEKNYLQAMYIRMLESGADMVVCRSKSLDVATGEIKNIEYAVRDENLPDKEIFNIDDIKGNVFRTFVGWPWDKMYKKEFVSKYSLKFQEISSTNDLFFVFGSIVLATKICVCDEYLILHKIGNMNSVSNSRERYPKNFIIALQEFKKFMENNQLYMKYKMDFIEYAKHAYMWNIKSLKGLASVEIYKLKNEFIQYFELEQADFGSNL